MVFLGQKRNFAAVPVDGVSGNQQRNESQWTVVEGRTYPDLIWDTP